MSETREHLVFSLTAMLAAMGDVAGIERRESWSWPGRSAILGLLGAALGLDRKDQAAHAALDGLGMCVAVYDEATAPLRDFHTVQTVPNTAAKRPVSRREALRTGSKKLNTVITKRDYRMGVHYGVALWGDAGRPLSAVREALLRPVYTLYLGRKSCPLAAPVAPHIIAAETPIDALAQTPPAPWRETLSKVRFYASDPFDDRTARVEIRQDAPLDREYWHFGQRSVLILPGEAS